MNAIRERPTPNSRPTDSPVGRIAHTPGKRSPHLDGGTHSWDAAFSPACLPTLIRCYHRVRAWRLPPNWSAFDWSEELKEVLCVAAWQAETNFDPSRGVPFDRFLYQRGMARALTRYRQEWCYGTRFQSGDTDIGDLGEEEQDSLECNARHGGREAVDCCCESDPLPEHGMLEEALAALSALNRRLITLLYFDGRTECEIAVEFGVSQPAICKRKQVALRALHRWVARQK